METLLISSQPIKLQNAAFYADAWFLSLSPSSEHIYLVISTSLTVRDVKLLHLAWNYCEQKAPEAAMRLDVDITCIDLSCLLFVVWNSRMNNYKAAPFFWTILHVCSTTRLAEDFQSLLYPGGNPSEGLAEPESSAASRPWTSRTETQLLSQTGFRWHDTCWVVKSAPVAVFFSSSSSSSAPEPLYENSSLACHVTADDRICVTACRLWLLSLADGKKEKSSNAAILQTAKTRVDQYLLNYFPADWCFLRINPSSDLTYEYPLDSTHQCLSVKPH